MQLWGGDMAGSLSHIAFWKVFLFIFFTEELLHYWIHRYAHEWRWLWKIHRTHHSAQQLNVGVVYRYNIFLGDDATAIVDWRFCNLPGTG
jgi:sterol desaturase/sphingolipid hydroxylase (fatty acid hydroxylase superfamily)